MAAINQYAPTVFQQFFFFPFPVVLYEMKKANIITQIVYTNTLLLQD